jgi:hypothetical protein
MANDRINNIVSPNISGIKPYNVNTNEFVFSANGYIDLGSTFTFKTVKERTPLQKLGIDKLTFNRPATIIHHVNGDKTVVKTTDNDSYNPIYGFLLAYFQKTSGMTKTQANKFIDEVGELALKQELEKSKKKSKKLVEGETKVDNSNPVINNGKFKVGDKVRVINEDSNSNFHNQTGTIGFDDGGDSLQYAVEFDDENTDGHDCATRHFKGFNHSNGLWFDGCNLELI